MSAKTIDGMQIEHYADFFKWDATRWAWEFLSRNQEYRSICEDLDSEPDPKEARLVAKTFGLKKYKSAFDEYDVPGSPAPCFLPNTVYAQARLTKKDCDVYRRPLSVGDMVVRFSLLDAAANPAALDAKLRATQQLAQRKLAKLQAMTKTKPIAVRIGHDKDWVALLRLLDALRAKIAPEQIAKVIFPSHCTTKAGHPKTTPQLRELIKDRRKRAQALAQKRYLYLAAWPGKPVAGSAKPTA